MDLITSVNPVQQIVAGELQMAVPEADRTKFSQLWALHTQLLEQGKVIFFFTEGMVAAIDGWGKSLQPAADKLCALLNENTYVHFDPIARSYRIGAIKDQYDFVSTSQNILVYYKERPQLQTTMPSVTPRPASQIQQEVLSSLYATCVGASISPPVETAATFTKTEKISKPSNAWILYRKSKHHVVSQDNPGIHTSEISTVIGNMWKQESEQVKAFWYRKADHEKLMHSLRYPDYKTRPRKSSEIKRRTKKITEVRVATPIVSLPTSAPQNQSSNKIDTLWSLQSIQQNDMEDFMTNINAGTNKSQFGFDTEFDLFETEFTHI